MSGVSVALATYNGARFLREQLDSLARQSRLPDELVAWDDGSADGTVGILEAFTRDSPFEVKIHRTERNVGFSEAFLGATSLCSGDAIAFCDQDDVWLDRKLERCLADLQDPDVLLVIHSSEIVDEALAPTGVRYPQIDADARVPPLHGDPWLAVRGMSMVFARGLLTAADARFRPPSHYRTGVAMHHDEWIYSLGRGLGTTALVSEPLALYRQHERNVAGAPRARARLREAFDTGWTYYSRRATQARELARIFAEADADPSRAQAAASSYAALAETLEERVSVYDPHASRTSRARRLAGVARGGLYAPRSRGGFGRRAALRDAAMIVLGRS